MKKNKKILFVGGGTGGHILPLLNLVQKSIERNLEVFFILADQKIDREIVKKNFLNFEKKEGENGSDGSPKNLGIQTYFLRTGKMRRYFSWQNFIDFFQVFLALFRARKILKETNPDIIFFKGGFVCFPILIASKFLFSGFRGRMYLHESDVSFSNLGKFIGKFCDRVFLNFGENALPLFYENEKFPGSKCLEKNEGEKISGLKQILIFGGSQGAQFINEIFLENAGKICERYFVNLVCGPGKEIDFEHKNFHQFELLSADNFFQKLSESDLVISRASASVFQILSLQKKSILIPLPSSARDHQEKNARYLEKKGVIKYLKQDEKAAEKLSNLIEESFEEAKIWEAKLKKFDLKNKSEEILEIILAA